MTGRVLMVTLVLLNGVTPAMAVQRTQLGMAQLQGAGWQAEQVELTLRLGEPLQARLKVGRATLQQLKQPLRDLVIDCTQVEVQAEHFSCAEARISGVFPYLGRQRFNGSARYARSNGAIELHLNELSLAKGRAQLQARLAAGQWHAGLDLQNTDLTELLKLAQQLSVPVGMSGSGQLDAHIEAQGRDSRPAQLQWQLDARQLTLNNPAGTLATDMLNLQSSGMAHLTNASWQIGMQLDAPRGQGYVEPIFVDFSQHALHGELQATWDGKTQLAIQRLDIQQQQVAIVSANGRLQLDANNPAPQLNLQIAELKLPGSFATYVQPFLLYTSFKKLNTRGTLQGSVQIIDSLPVQADVQLYALHADDGSTTLQFDDINGELHWLAALADEQSAPHSMLSWQRGSLLGMELGATQIPLQLWGDNARIAEPSRIPVFNGALAIDALRVRKAGKPQMAFMLDAMIEPINVAQLSRAFGWPEFGGELSGKITKLRLQDGVLTLGATLNAQVFEGEVSISNMRMEGALTPFPRFDADIALKQLNLEQVTQAFSFGRITGRLSGEINDLSLFNWEPVAFDAKLYTPDADRSRHRISQRAVQNIGSVGGSGGGVTAALQTGVLKFFEDFNYDKLGVSCQLRNEVCVMNGVAPAKDGAYYLVTGRGIPRIDVIGNGTRVDWPRLVAQLKAVTESEGPVVK